MQLTDTWKGALPPPRVRPPRSSPDTNPMPLRPPRSPSSCVPWRPWSRRPSCGRTQRRKRPNTSARWFRQCRSATLRSWCRAGSRWAGRRTSPSLNANSAELAGGLGVPPNIPNPGAPPGTAQASEAADEGSQQAMQMMMQMGQMAMQLPHQIGGMLTPGPQQLMQPIQQIVQPLQRLSSGGGIGGFSSTASSSRRSRRSPTTPWPVGPALGVAGAWSGQLRCLGRVAFHRNRR
jgi:hypothetical protein